MKLAITGKGGVGKTTVAGTLARMLADDGYKVLAIDADPDANLAWALGFPEDVASKIPPLAELKELVKERTGAGEGYGVMFRLNPKVDDIPDKYSQEYNKVKLLLMGTVPKGGAGCVCPENVVIKRLIEEVLVYRDEAVILDMEAGLEHLGRGTAAAVDALVVVVEPGLRSIGTAHNIERLAADLQVPSVKVVANKITDEKDRQFIESHFDRERILGCLSFSSALARADQTGTSPYDCDDERFLAEMKGIEDRLTKSLQETKGGTDG